MTKVTVTDDKGNTVKVDTEKGTAEKVEKSESFVDRMIREVGEVGKAIVTGPPGSSKK